MVMDVGGGTSEITAFCYGGLLAHRSSRIAGDELTLALHRYLRAEHQLLVGELTVEALKCRVDLDEGLSSVVQGVDLATGRPRLVTLESEEVLEALRPTVDAILAALAGALDDLPPQAADDILTDGVMLFGGSTLLRGFNKLVESAFAFPVRMSERPLTCVAEGAARCSATPTWCAPTRTASSTPSDAPSRSARRRRSPRASRRGGPTCRICRSWAKKYSITGSTTAPDVLTP